MAKVSVIIDEQRTVVQQVGYTLEMNEAELVQFQQLTKFEQLDVLKDKGEGEVLENDFDNSELLSERAYDIEIED